MLHFDYEDFQRRLVFAGYEKDSEVYTTIMRLAVVLDNEEISDTSREIVLNLFSKSALDQLIEVPTNVLGQTVWKSFDYGNVQKGEYVRVRLDAYDSLTGQKHNGRVGILMDMAAWRCKVKYLGMPGIEIMTHPMDNLESLQKV